MARLKVQVTKCYLVQVLDEDEAELKWEYVFGDKDAAKEVGRQLKAEAQKELAEQEQ